MLKIIGSSRVDDFNRVVLEDGVMKALDIVEGDSVLVYKRLNEEGLGIYKAEGACVSNECDSPRRNHLMGMPVRLRLLLSVCAVAVTLGLFVLLASIGDISDPLSLSALIVWIIAMALMFTAITASQMIDRGYESERFVTSGNPYVKDRQVGFSKLTGDGYIYTGQVYVNSLFGSNPSAVDILLHLKDGREISILSSCVKSVSGYSMYKLRFKEDELVDGTFNIKLTFPYISKSLTLYAVFNMNVGDDGRIIISEGPLTADMKFDTGETEGVCERADYAEMEA